LTANLLIHYTNDVKHTANQQRIITFNVGGCSGHK